MTKKDKFPKVKTNAMKMFLFFSKFGENKIYNKNKHFLKFYLDLKKKTIL